MQYLKYLEVLTCLSQYNSVSDCVIKCRPYIYNLRKVNVSFPSQRIMHSAIHDKKALVTDNIVLILQQGTKNHIVKIMQDCVLCG